MKKRQKPQKSSKPTVNKPASKPSSSSQPNGNAGSSPRPTFRVESLEPRILMSATWVDADTDASQSGADSGNDVYTGTSGNDSANGLGGNDVLNGLAGNDSLFGGEGNDTLDGGANNDVLNGDAGNDILIGGDGNDTLNGGSGTDTADYSTAGAGVTVSLNGEVDDDDDDDHGHGHDDDDDDHGHGHHDDDDDDDDDDEEVNASGGAGNDTLNDIENITGSNFNDTLIGDGGANVLSGGLGNDTLNGNSGDDTLLGGEGNNVIDGGSGADVISSGAGSDIVEGDSGDDTISAGDGANQVYGGSGRDTISVGSGNDYVDAGSGDDTVTTGTGNDTIIGGSGKDTITAGDGQDSINAGSGDDVVSAGTGNDTVYGGSGKDTLTGGEGSDTIRGDSGDDTIDGGAGNDDLYGGSGKDTFAASGGSDSMHGDSGQDTFQFANAQAGDTYTVDGGSSNDTIDLSTYSSNQVTQSLGRIDVAKDGGSFTIFHSNVETVKVGGAENNLDVVTGAADNSDSLDVAEVDAPTNFGPVADAGTDQVANEGEIVTLSASNSMDPEGSALTYTWTQTGGTSVALSNPNGASPSFTAPQGLANSTLAFKVQVSDGTNVTEDTVTITVNADNDAPSANAGSDQTVSEGATVQLSGNGTDPEGQGLSYQWVQTAGPSVTLSNATSANPTFTAPEGVSNTAVTFELRASDGTNTSVDTITVNVNADNDAPSANAGADQTVNEGATVQLSGSGTDPEGQGLSYQWVQTAGPSVTLSNANAANPTFTAPEGVSNTAVTFELRASDGTNTSVDTITVNVNADNDAPSANAGADQLISEGATVQLNGSATDPEGQGLTYQWVQTGGPAVTLSNVNSPTPTFVAPNSMGHTPITFQLTVTDSEGASHTDTVVMTVRDPQVESYVHGLTFQQFRNLTAEEVDYLTPQQIASIPNNDWLGTMSAGARASLDQTQIQALNTSVVGLNHLTQQQRDWLTPNQVQQVGYQQFRYLSASGVDSLTPQQMATIPTNDWLGTMSADARASLDQAQVQAINTSVVGLNHLTQQQRDWLTPNQVQQVGYQQFRYLSASGVDHLTPQQIATIPTNDWLGTMSADSRASLDQAQVQAINTSVVGLNHLTAQQREWLTTDQVQRLGYQQFRYVAVSKIPDLTTAQIATIPTADWFNTMSADQRNALTHDQIRALPNNLTNVSYVGGGTNDSLSGNTNVNKIIGGAGADTLSGGDGNDVLDGGDGADVLNGGSGRDLLIAGGGNDVASGGTGNDTVAFEGARNGDVITVDGGADSDTIDLRQFQSSSAQLSTGRIVVNTGNGESFTINHSNMEQVRFADASVALSYNAAPTVDAGSDQTVSEGATVQLAGSGTDPEGQGLSYQWVQTAGPSVTLSNANAANPTFSAPEGVSNTAVTFELRASDGTNTSVDTITVNVNADNDAPSANAGSDQTVSEGATVQLAGSGTDPEGQGLSYEWVQTAGPSVTLSNANSSSPTFVAPSVATDTTMQFELRVSDGNTTSISTSNVQLTGSGVSSPAVVANGTPSNAPVLPSQPSAQADAGSSGADSDSDSIVNEGEESPTQPPTPEARPQVPPVDTGTSTVITDVGSNPEATGSGEATPSSGSLPGVIGAIGTGDSSSGSTDGSTEPVVNTPVVGNNTTADAGSNPPAISQVSTSGASSSNESPASGGNVGPMAGSNSNPQTQPSEMLPTTPAGRGGEEIATANTVPTATRTGESRVSMGRMVGDVSGDQVPRYFGNAPEMAAPDNAGTLGSVGFSQPAGVESTSPTDQLLGDGIQHVDLSRMKFDDLFEEVDLTAGRRAHESADDAAANSRFSDVSGAARGESSDRAEEEALQEQMSSQGFWARLWGAVFGFGVTSRRDHENSIEKKLERSRR